MGTLPPLRCILSFNQVGQSGIHQLEFITYSRSRVLASDAEGGCCCGACYQLPRLLADNRASGISCVQQKLEQVTTPAKTLLLSNLAGRRQAHARGRVCRADTHTRHLEHVCMSVCVWQGYNICIIRTYTSGHSGWRGCLRCQKKLLKLLKPLKPTPRIKRVVILSDQCLRIWIYTLGD